jgi:transcriptional regulator with XRE-family HTH domain
VTDWARLGERVRSERIRLGHMTQAAFARRAGIGRRTVSDLERGTRGNYSPDTLAAVEGALGWEPGTVAAVLAGGAVVREGDDDLARLMHLWRSLDPAGRRIMLAVAATLADLADDTPG